MMDNSSSLDCAICKDHKPGKPFYELNCRHSFHTPCLRKYLRTLQRVNSDANLPCPFCRTPALPIEIEILSTEPRCLNFRYSLPRCFSAMLNSEVRVVARPESSGDIYVRSNTMKVCDLPPDPNHVDHKFLMTDFEVDVQNPQTKFFVWVEFAHNEAPISRIYKLGTTSLEDSMEETEREEESTSESEEEEWGSIEPPAPSISASPTLAAPVPQQSNHTVARSQNQTVTRRQNQTVTRRQNQTVVRSQNQTVASSQNQTVASSQNQILRALLSTSQPENRVLQNYRRRYTKLLIAQEKIRRAELSLRQAQENGHQAMRLLNDAFLQMLP